MKIKTRLLIGVLSLLFLAAGVITLGIFLELINVSGTGLENLAGQPEAGIAGGIILVVGIIMFLVITLSKSRKPQEKKSRSIVLYNETGEIRIALEAVENMVLRVSRQIKGIRETETRVDATEQGLLVYAKVKVLPDIAVPQLISDFQNQAKEYLEEITGTSVAEVKVLVENIVADQASSRVK